MIQVRAVLRVMGPSFSPREAGRLTGVALSNTQEPGAVSSGKRHASRQASNGSAEIVAKENAAFLDGDDEEFFASAAKLAGAARVLGAQDVVLHVDVEHDGQCNMELKPSFFSAVHKLGVTVTITCYQVDRDEPAGSAQER